MKKSVILLTFLFISQIGFSQFIRENKLENYPEVISQIVKNHISSVFEVDFNGDEEKDYIIESKDQNGVVTEYWIDSDFTLVYKAIFSEEINYRFLLNLDSDPDLEIFRALGYEDGINYTFRKINLSEKDEEIIFYFNPVISRNDLYYWGYPWDIEEIIIKNKKIFTSIDHEIIRDGEVTIPDDQKLLPVIMFKGVTKQYEYTVKEINETSWLTLAELKTYVFN